MSCMGDPVPTEHEGGSLSHPSISPMFDCPYCSGRHHRGSMSADMCRAYHEFRTGELVEDGDVRWRPEGSKAPYINAPWAWISPEIVIRDKYACQWCGLHIPGGYRLEVHHIIPRISGGSDHPHNLVTLCHDCHARTFGNHYELRTGHVDDGILPGDPRFYENREEVRVLVEKALQVRIEAEFNQKKEEMDRYWESISVERREDPGNIDD